ncbi:hypothetical protein [Streptomyces sp. NPDC002619]
MTVSKVGVLRSPHRRRAQGDALVLLDPWDAAGARVFVEAARRAR